MQLSQIIAIEKGLKTRTEEAITKLHRAPGDFDGMIKTFSPTQEDGFVHPEESKKVTATVPEVLSYAALLYTPLIDLMLTKETANMSAKADVVVAGKVVIKDAPVTFLVQLEKVLINVRTFVTNLPVLDIKENWEWDKNKNLYTTPVSKTTRTKKEVNTYAIPNTAFPEQGIAPQIATTTVDVVEGTWDLVKHSGAISVADKAQILDRVNAFSDAVKVAREKANTATVTNIAVTEKIFSDLFKI